MSVLPILYNSHAILLHTTPCFKGPFYLGEEFLLIPGHIDLDKHFYAHPIDVFYVQIDKLEKTKDSCMVAFLRLFSKDYARSYDLKVKLKSHLENHIPLLNNYVNWLNLYIEKGNELDDLHIKKVETSANFEPLTVNTILDFINALEFKFFEK